MPINENISWYAYQEYVIFSDSDKLLELVHENFITYCMNHDSKLKIHIWLHYLIIIFLLISNIKYKNIGGGHEF